MKTDMLKQTEIIIGANTMALANIKQEAHHLIDQLPDNATWKDIAYEAYVHQEIEAGLEVVKNGEIASDEDVKQAFSQWGIQLEA